MTPFLLDVNVLIALLDPDHLHHDTAYTWFEETGQQSWATCPIIENAVVRILSNPAYPLVDWLPSDVVSLLQQFLAQSEGHQFWGDVVSLLDPGLVNHGLIQGHRQLTDIYLLALAVNRKASLVTFDRSISTATVCGATDSSICLLV